jgi:hypothetical protein
MGEICRSASSMSLSHIRQIKPTPSRKQKGWPNKARPVVLILEKAMLVVNGYKGVETVRGGQIIAVRIDATSDLQNLTTELRCAHSL